MTALRARSRLLPNARIVHIDIDASELDKIKTAHVGIVGDVREVLETLLPMVEAQPRTAWLTHVEELKAMYPLQTPGVDDPCTPYGLVLQTATGSTMMPSLPRMSVSTRCGWRKSIPYVIPASG